MASSEPTVAQPASFVPFLRSIGEGNQYQIHQSPTELSTEADLTVLGTIRSVGDGRVFGHGATRDDEPVNLNLTYAVHVDRVLAGDASLVRDGFVYVELPRSKYQTIEAADRALPVNQRVVLFLGDYSEDMGWPLTAPSPVVPEGAPTLAPYTEGFLVEDQTSKSLIGGLESLDQLPSAWSEHDGSLAQFVSANFVVK
ncbi:hypothetical protein [Flexivirga alba]|uniref:Uncharacterized protein n=1 Tax=Flexivirga alba TaxID=702742 RepID=A0ABW2ADD0_9MICO